MSTPTANGWRDQNEIALAANYALGILEGINAMPDTFHRPAVTGAIRRLELALYKPYTAQPLPTPSLAMTPEQPCPQVTEAELTLIDRLIGPLHLSDDKPLILIRDFVHAAVEAAVADISRRWSDDSAWGHATIADLRAQLAAKDEEIKRLKGNP